MYISSYLGEEMEAAVSEELKGTETDQIASQHKMHISPHQQEIGGTFYKPDSPSPETNISYPPLDPPQPLAREG